MKKIKILITAALVLTLLVISAGCITNDSGVKTTETEIPADMYKALEDLSTDLSTLEHVVLSELSGLSEQITKSDSEKEIKNILSEYYAKNPSITAVIFHDSIHNDYISVPVFIDVDLSSYSSNITEQDFKEAGGFIVRNNVFSKYHGYLNLYYKPVYTKENKYHGYLVFAVDVYSMLYLHPSMMGEEKSYGEYICFITDRENNILYSSIQETTGQVLPKNGYYDGLVYIPSDISGDGACKYTSRGFYYYDSNLHSEKITAWHQLYSTHGTEYTLYVVKDVDLQELKTKNVFTLSTLQSLNDARGAFVYGSTHGFNELVKRVNSGYYISPISVMDKNGNVIASSKSWSVGLNYLNNRGMYGVSYVLDAIHSAEQGGGYIYYLIPVERVVFPRAAQYTLGIVMPINDQENDYYIYTDMPGSVDAVILDKDLRPDLTLVSHTILKEASVNGLDYVVDKINNNHDNAAEQFVPDLKTEIKDIAVIDVYGKVYASIAFPELVGKSATFITDVYGGSATRRTNMLAENGGGYMAQLHANSDKEGYVDLWIASVEPVDEKYYIYTATIIGTFEDVLTPVLDKTIPTE